MAEYYFSDSEGEKVIITSSPAYKNNYICSPMNYIGGKHKLLPQLLPLFPHKIRTFVDLFCGGCNVGINVRAEKVIFNDNLSYLIDLYKTFNTFDQGVIISHIESRIAQHTLSLTNEEGYKTLRRLYNEERNPLDLFVLVAYSFNHQIRFNNSHEFNNPFGKNRSSFNAKMKRNLLTFLNALQKRSSEFVCFNFNDFDFSFCTEDDFIYCDPPYLITTGTYNDGKRGFTGWSTIEEEKLLHLLSQLNGRNIKFGLSNVLIHKGKENDLLKQWALQNKFYIIHLNKNYSNSNYHTGNRDPQATDEVFITNYKPFQEYTLFTS